MGFQSQPEASQGACSTEAIKQVTKGECVLAEASRGASSTEARANDCVVVETICQSSQALCLYLGHPLLTASIAIVIALYLFCWVYFILAYSYCISYA